MIIDNKIESNTPFLAVWMVAYNHEEYIEQAIESIVNQITNFNFKLFIGEDCSTDSTKILCTSLKKKYPTKINLYYNAKNLGATKNGINTYKKVFNSGAKYIALCEGDDYWTDPLKLQKQVDYLESNKKFAGSFHDTLTINETQENAVLKPFRVYDKNIFKLEDAISTTALFHTSSFVFRTSLLNLPNWFAKVQSSDMALFAIVASAGPLYRVDETMSVYRKNEGGITNRITIKSYHKRRIELFRYLKLFCYVKVHSNIDEVISYHKSELKKIAPPSLKSRIKKLLRS